jgi:hypothetical protein
MTVTESSVPMRRKAFGGGRGFFFAGAARAAPRPGITKAMTSPVPEGGEEVAPGDGGHG